jgi:hypothetical protein
MLRGTNKRVRVVLFNGMRPAETWPADGKGACSWRISRPPFAFEIKEWEFAE